MGGRTVSAAVASTGVQWKLPRTSATKKPTPSRMSSSKDDLVRPSKTVNNAPRGVPAVDNPSLLSNRYKSGCYS